MKALTIRALILSGFLILVLPQLDEIGTGMTADRKNGASSFSSVSAQDADPVRDLAVRITTRRSRGAGTDDAVYFDIGPLSWKLGKPNHNDFEKGSEDTYELIRNGVNRQTKEAVTLNREDILWLRLHKKGIVGVTGTGDGFDGAWHPESITLIVNGQEDKPLPIEFPLNSRCWYWRSKDPKDNDLRTFARSLRIVRNQKMTLVNKATGLVTTSLFKKHGISGWLLNPAKKECSGSPPRHIRACNLPLACVTGEVVAKATSTDGLQTIDLRVMKLEFRSETSAILQVLSLDSETGFSQSRYIRVENRFAPQLIHRRTTPTICGRILWDTDHEGWWEIHPRSSADLSSGSR